VDIRASPLPPDVQQRLIALAGHRVTADGVLLIDSREYRTQGQNREAARVRLAELVGRALTPPKKRRPTRPKAGAREKRLTSKKHRGETKAARARGRSGNDD